MGGEVVPVPLDTQLPDVVEKRAGNAFAAVLGKYVHVRNVDVRLCRKVLVGETAQSNVTEDLVTAERGEDDRTGL